MWKNETHQREIQVFARRDHKPRSLVTKSGHEKQCCRRLDEDSESTRAKEHVDHTENRAVGNKQGTHVHQPDRLQEEDLDAGSPGRQSKYST